MGSSISNAVHRTGDDDFINMAYIRGNGVLASIPDEVKPRPKIGRNPKTSKSHSKIKNESLRSALSVELDNPEAERIRKEFEMFRLNKENELSNFKRKEKKLDTENKKLKTELQALQKTCKKLRDERDYALDAEQRALMRAAAIESDRDKVQRQFKIFRETKESELQSLLKVKRNLELKISKLDTSLLDNELILQKDDSDPIDGWTIADSIVGLYPSYGINNNSDNHNHGNRHHHQDCANSTVTQNLDAGSLLRYSSDTVAVYWFSWANKYDDETKEDVCSKVISRLERSCQVEGHVLDVLKIPLQEISSDDKEDSIERFFGLAEQNFMSIAIISDFSPADCRHRKLLEDIASLQYPVEVFLVASPGECDDGGDGKHRWSAMSGSERSGGDRSTAFVVSETVEELSGKLLRVVEEKLKGKYSKHRLDCLNFLGWDDIWRWQDLQDHFFHECLSQNFLPSGAHQSRLQRFGHSEGQHCTFTWFEKSMEKINGHVSSAGPVPPLLVDGPEGSGKTTLLVKWVSQYRERSPPSFVLFYSVLHPDHPSSDPMIVVKCLMFQIMQCFSTPFPLAYDHNQLVRDFPKWLDRVSVLFSGGVVLVVDSIDHVQNFEVVFDWLMDPLPVDLRVVVSAGTDAYPPQWRSWPLLLIDPMSEKEVRRFVHVVSEEFSNFDEGAVLTRLLDDSSLCLPLPIILSMHLLRMSSRFMVATSECRTTHDLYVTFLRILGEKWDKYLLETVSKEGELNLIVKTLMLIDCCRSGLSLSGLVDAMGKSVSKVADVVCTLMENKLVSRRCGLYVLDNDHVRTALVSWFNSRGDYDDVAMTTMKELQSWYLHKTRNRPATCRSVEQLAWISFKLQDWDVLRVIVADVQFCVALLKRGLSLDLMGYWKALNFDLVNFASQTDKQLQEYRQRLEDEEVTNDCYDILAETYEVVGKFMANHAMQDEALRILQKCIEVHEHDLELGGLKIGHVSNLLGQIHEKLGRRNAAETLYLQALALFESVANHDDDDVNNDNINDDDVKTTRHCRRHETSHCCDQCDDDDDDVRTGVEKRSRQGQGGDESDRRGVSCQPQRYHYHHLVAAQLDLLAGLHLKQGRVEMSENFLKKSAQVRARAGLQTSNKTKQVSAINKESIRQRIESLQELFGSGQLDVLSLATIEHKLGILNAILGHYKEAETFLIGSLDRRQSLLPGDHSDIVQSLNSLVILYSQTKQINNVDEISQKLMNSLQKSGGKTSPLVIRTLKNLVFVNRSIGRVERTEMYMEMLLSAMGQSSSTLSEDFASALVNMAVFYSQQGKHVRAEPLYQRALSTYKFLLPFNHPRILETTKNLALSKYEQGDFETAAQLYLLTIKGNHVSPR